MATPLNFDEEDLVIDELWFSDRLSPIDYDNQNLEDGIRESVDVLFTGDVGAGKSSLINGLFGREVAPEALSPNAVTIEVNDYTVQRNSPYQVKVWDSPGLHGGLEDKQRLPKLKAVMGRIDLTVYCIRMDSRFNSSTQNALKQFNKLGPNVWEHAVIALTHANQVDFPDCKTDKEEIDCFYSLRKEWTQSIRQYLCNELGIEEKVVRGIFFVQTGYHCITRKTPNPWYLHAECHNWFQAFWVACVAACTIDAGDVLISMNERRIVFAKPQDVRDYNDRPIHEQPIAIFEGIGPQEFANMFCKDGNETIKQKLIALWRKLCQKCKPKKV